MFFEAEGHLGSPADLIDWLERTADELWSRVEDRARAAKEGDIHWSAALEDPYAVHRRDVASSR